MSVENQNDGIISIGEPIMKPMGSLSVNRITTPNGPWVWELALADSSGTRVGDISLTSVDLRELRNLLGKAIAMEQGTSSEDSSSDRFVLFEVFEGEENVGRVALLLSWSENDVLIELKSRGYPTGGRVKFKDWPSSKNFELEIMGDVLHDFKFASIET